MMPSKPVLVNTTFTPSTLPRAAPRSGSKPTIVLLSLANDSTGAYDASVAILMTPAFLMLSGSVMAPPEAGAEDAPDDDGAEDAAELAGAELPGAELAALVA